MKKVSRYCLDQALVDGLFYHVYLPIILQQTKQVRIIPPFMKYFLLNITRNLPPHFSPLEARKASGDQKVWYRVGIVRSGGGETLLIDTEKYSRFMPRWLPQTELHWQSRLNGPGGESPVGFPGPFRRALYEILTELQASAITNTIRQHSKATVVYKRAPSETTGSACSLEYQELVESH